MSAWTAETIPPETIIPVPDIVALVRAVLTLGKTTSRPRLALTRSGTNGYTA
jgi:3-oxoacyl-[acyl-carrier protein] reductase